ncbi:hypothetical protein [Oceanithermus desulfurans]|uniref:Lipoprotein n=2 Tax=Oceanithermus desulfurans TaxID=227924 RepID=A0A511RJL1_9DEIN|nr:hypothetical protein [Oceanithermus desulfurans]MBB6029879.1 hypothetical protein [Oceanithermus desulfurans]GEM89840.1 hypothetical protein ODE01S_12740 [Oceanithermus desulfurans NBRC 100063]
MRRTFAVPVLALLAALWLGGCNQQQGTEVSVKLINQWGTPATATVIYQVGDGAWKLAAQKDYGEYSFMVPPGETRYGVSVNCLPGIPLLSTFGFFTTYQLTTNDTTAPVFSCLNISDQQFTEVTVNWDVSAVGGDRLRTVAPADDSEDASSPDTVQALVGSQQPFLYLAYNGSFDFANLVGMRYERSDLSGYDNLTATFTAADTLTTGTVSGPSAPSGFSGCDFGAAFATPEGLFAEDLGQGSGSPCSGSFAKVPGAGSDDVYVMQASYQDIVNDRSLISMAFPAAAGIGNVNLPALPTAWPTSYSVTAAALPTFDLDHPDADVTGYMILYAATTATSGPTSYWQIYVSPDWLDNATGYTLPDLSSAPDFSGLKPLSGDEAMWQVAAFFSDRPIGDWLSSTRWIPTGGPIVAPVLPGTSMGAASISGTYTVP